MSLDNSSYSSICGNLQREKNKNYIQQGRKCDLRRYLFIKKKLYASCKTKLKFRSVLLCLITNRVFFLALTATGRQSLTFSGRPRDFPSSLKIPTLLKALHCLPQSRQTGSTGSGTDSGGVQARRNGDGGGDSDDAI